MYLLASSLILKSLPPIMRENNMKKMNGLSLFASAGIAEMNLKKCGVNMVVANELLPIRAKTHEFWHPNCKMICGDITNEIIKKG